MLKIKKQYVIDEHNEPVGVIVDIETFQEIESLVEDHLLSKSMEEVADEKPLAIEEARKRYAKMKKRR